MTKTKAKKEKGIAPPGESNPKGLAAPPAPPAQAVGSKPAEFLAQQNIPVATPKDKKKTVATVERKDMADKIESYCEAIFKQKSGEDQAGKIGPGIKEEAEKERLAVCVKDDKAYQSIYIGDVCYTSGKLVIMIQPHEDKEHPEKSITIEQIDQTLVAAFGTIENVRKYTEWATVVNYKLVGKPEIDLDILMSQLMPEEYAKLRKKDPEKHLDYKKSDVMESMTILTLKTVGDVVLLMEAYSKDETMTVGTATLKVRDAVNLLKSEKFKLLSQGGGALKVDGNTLARIGTKFAEQEKRAKDALQQLAEMQARAVCAAAGQ